MQIKSGIYEIVNSANGKRYIGSAISFGRRWTYHRRDLRAGKHHSRYLQASWDEHGEKSFAFRVIELVPDAAHLISREQHYIDTLCPEFNTRPLADSMLGFRHSDASRARMSAAAIGKNVSAETRGKIGAAHRGKIVSTQTRSKMSAARRGMKFTAEHRANLSASHKGNKLSPEAHAKLLSAALAARETNAAEYREKLRTAMIGRKFSDETRVKMSAAKRGKQPRLGTKHSLESRAQMSRAAKARCQSRTVSPS